MVDVQTQNDDGNGTETTETNQAKENMRTNQTVVIDVRAEGFFDQEGFDKTAVISNIRNNLHGTNTTLESVTLAGPAGKGLIVNVETRGNIILDGEIDMILESVKPVLESETITTVSEVEIERYAVKAHVNP